MLDIQRGVHSHREPPALWNDPPNYWAHLNNHTAHLPAPVVALHEPALLHNAAQLVQRAQGLPVRVASKSLRVRGVLEAVLRIPGFRGILAYTLHEALWLSQRLPNIVLGYPTADRHALSQLITDARAATHITLMVDQVDQLDLIDSIAEPRNRENIRVCIDLDASLRIGSAVHLGVRRSPVHSASAALQLAREIVHRPGFTLVGIMAYEAQIAGVGNHNVGPLRGLAVRAMQRISARELAARRGSAVHQIRQVCDLEFVNGGGTGSLETTTKDASVTEVSAGSGLFGSHLFDRYRAFALAPAVGFATEVVRLPGTGIATVLGGGWVASGESGRDRLPKPVWPAPLTLLPREGAGEVQTPLRGTAVSQLRIGDRVWMRHAKAGEIMEHTNSVIVVDSRVLPAELPSYRGEGKDFL